MTVRLTDLRCPTAMCGKKLAEAVQGSAGQVQIKCPRCGKVVTIRFS
jgi:phage FluMu protein Com